MCIECDLAEPESLASLGGSAPGLVDRILSRGYRRCLFGWAKSALGKKSLVQRDFNKKPCQDVDFVWVLEPLLMSLSQRFTLRMSLVRHAPTS